MDGGEEGSNKGRARKRFNFTEKRARRERDLCTQGCYKTLTLMQRDGEAALFPLWLSSHKDPVFVFTVERNRTIWNWKETRGQFSLLSHKAVILWIFPLTCSLCVLCMCVPAVAMFFLIWSEFGWTCWGNGHNYSTVTPPVFFCCLSFFLSDCLGSLMWLTCSLLFSFHFFSLLFSQKWLTRVNTDHSCHLPLSSLSQIHISTLLIYNKMHVSHVS